MKKRILLTAVASLLFNFAPLTSGAAAVDEPETAPYPASQVIADIVLDTSSFRHFS
jgi:hypothetical protein